MRTPWLLLKFIHLAAIFVLGSVFVLDCIFLSAVQTVRGCMIGVSGLALCWTPILFYAAPRCKKNAFWLRTAQICAVIAVGLLVYTLITAPAGDGESSPLTHEYIAQNTFNRFDPFNIIPEIDQINFGLLFIPHIDPKITRQQADYVKRLTGNIYAELDADDGFSRLGSVLGLCYADILGRQYNAGHYYLYIPKSYMNAPIPVMVFLHGSLGNFKGYYWILSKIAEAKGLAVIAPSYGAGNWRQDPSMTLIREALSDASHKINIDRNNVYLAGISNGGLGVTKLASESPNLFKGLIYLSPVFDYPIMDNPSFTEEWRGKPILVISGKADRRIPARYLQERTAILQKGGVKIKEVYYDHEDHFLFFSRPENVLNEMSDWLDEQFSL